MAVEINKSFVPRAAVEKTIRRGIAMYERMHGPATRQVIEKIEREVIHQAEILNFQSKIKDDESSVGSALYAGRKNK